MANWEVKSTQEIEDEGIEKWGKKEWYSRKQVCDTKRDELEAEHGFEARCIVGSQFESVAIGLKQENWDKLKKQHVNFWYDLVLKLAGFDTNNQAVPDDTGYRNE